MGWSSGSSLMAGIIVGIRKLELDDETRRKLYRVLIKNFEDYDCDTLRECEDMDVQFKAALKRRR